MEAIVLAGGFGTRLRSVVSGVPKPMAPVAGRPFLELLLASLKARGITRVILSVGYMYDVITSYFDEHPIGLDLEYEIESAPLGTGGAMRAALRRITSEYALVLNGDTYLDLEIRELSAMWPGDRTPVVVARNVEDVARYGQLEVYENRIVRFLGSGNRGPGIINAGCYLVPSNMLADVRLPAAFSLEQDFLAPSPSLSLRAFVTNGHFIDIGVPEDYARAQIELATFARP